ncbi:hypothetical protein GUITHDRAFT_116661 [Guillardia theta CCMP2712]|uniref:ADP ribosyltransferase domain-containing protein n=1 Tax=Guillardia theta (strain CCMP2712) TaxID=905079 RepID=L1IMC2_GUITC|nr:hypothetical protein GUITHDRAFT_116661 [Guillardia theta CCMP2712]EKX37247.1 hypothetical protein GUITHDRAFT_116661 [Guillardia theta CCMP2712]|eukprot:XP_005824227.1 hypothetical protein GUITHDRAFT_116661 [Guillardia theta CCMP2712]
MSTIDKLRGMLLVQSEYLKKISSAHGKDQDSGKNQDSEAQRTSMKKSKSCDSKLKKSVSFKVSPSAGLKLHRTRRTNNVLSIMLQRFNGIAYPKAKIDEIFSECERRRSRYFEKGQAADVLKELGFHFSVEESQEIFRIMDFQNVGELDLQDLKQKLLRHRCKECLKGWFTDLDVYDIIAEKLLEDGRMLQDNPLKALAAHPDDLSYHLQDLHHDVLTAMQSGLEDMKDLSSRSQEGPSSSKFTSELPCTFSIKKIEFSKGLSAEEKGNEEEEEEQIDMMRKEHDALEAITSGCLDAPTNARMEWEFVTGPKEGVRYPGEEQEEEHVGRVRRSLEELMQQEVFSRSRLTKGELIGLRLYTGPMHVKYNESIRQYFNSIGDNDRTSYSGDFPTTIQLISSGILKLASSNSIPSNKKLYRCLKPNANDSSLQQRILEGSLLNMEPNFISASSEWKNISGKAGEEGEDGSSHLPIILEICSYDRTIGAELQWLSQYPHEDEIVFPPFACLNISRPISFNAHEGKEVVLLSAQIQVSGEQKEKTIE